MNRNMRRFIALLESIVFSAFFIWLWTTGFPRWLRLSGPEHPLQEQPWRWVGVPILVFGGTLALSCIWEFIWTGEGTPAPFDPPRRLVLRGLYRWVRNPMYFAFGIALIGEAILLADFTPRLFLYGAAMFAAVNVFIFLYEEPVLRGKFGDDYRDYCAHVGRWIPRLHPWTPDAGGNSAAAG